nr:unnamed protein product [Callosobruchus analis]
MSLYFTPGNFSSFTRLSKKSSEQFSRIRISLDSKSSPRLPKNPSMSPYVNKVSIKTVPMRGI